MVGVTVEPFFLWWRMMAYTNKHYLAAISWVFTQALLLTYCPSVCKQYIALTQPLHAALHTALHTATWEQYVSNTQPLHSPYILLTYCLHTATWEQYVSNTQPLHSPYILLTYCLHTAPRAKTLEFFHILELCGNPPNWLNFSKAKCCLFWSHFETLGLVAHNKVGNCVMSTIISIQNR